MIGNRVFSFTNIEREDWWRVSAFSGNSAIITQNLNLYTFCQATPIYRKVFQLIGILI